MAISRFDQPINNRIISQFVPQDVNMIARILAAKQSRYDEQEKQLELQQDAVSKLSGYGSADMGIIKNSRDQLDKLAAEYVNKDLADPRIAKELRTKTTAITNDPLLKATQITADAVRQYRDAKSKIKDYRRENDPFIRQLQNYQGAQDGPLYFTGMQEGVDELTTASKIFDGIPKSGQYTFAQMGDTFKKVGWEGVSADKIKQIAGNSIGLFANTSAGQQAIRRYGLMAQEGQLPLDKNGNQVSMEAYLGGILMSAGSSKIGGISTTGEVSGGAGMGAGFGSSPNGKRSEYTIGYTRPGTSSTSTIGVEDGKLKGSGNVSFQLGEPNTWLAWLTDKSLSKEEEKNPYMQVMTEVAKRNPQISRPELYQKFTALQNPKEFKLDTTAEQNSVSNYLFKDGAGGYNYYVVHDPKDGKILPGRNFMEEQGLINSDGELDEDMLKKKQVRVTGYHDPASGVARNGLHVSIGGNNYLFERPTDFNMENPTPADKAWADYELTSNGWADIGNGQFLIRDDQSPRKYSIFTPKQ